MLNKEEHCKEIFDMHVRVGQIIQVGKPQVKETYIVTEPDQDSIDFRIFTSNNREPTIRQTLVVHIWARLRLTCQTHPRDKIVEPLST